MMDSSPTFVFSIDRYFFSGHLNSPKPKNVQFRKVYYCGKQYILKFDWWIGGIIILKMTNIKSSNSLLMD